MEQELQILKLKQKNELLMKQLTHLVFVAETVAHLNGLESVLLPMCDSARSLMKDAVA